MSVDSSSVISPACWRKEESNTANADFHTAIPALHDQSVELRFPGSIAFDVKFLFPAEAEKSLPSQARIAVEEHGSGRFSICNGDNVVNSDLTRVELPIWLLEEVTEALITKQSDALALHAGAVAWRGTSIVLPGASGVGKSSLVAWLVDNGFDYLSDEIALLTKDSKVVAFPRALLVKQGAIEAVQGLSLFERVPVVRYGDSIFFSPSGPRADMPAQPCGLLVFPRFKSGASLRIEALTAAEAGLRMVECNLNARNFPDGGFAEITRLARGVPAINLEYGDFAQLDGTLDSVLRLAVEKQFTAIELRHFTAAFSGPAPAQPVTAAVKTYPIQQATPRKDIKPKLTIGMATFDDYDGVYFSLQALRLYHAESQDQIEFLLVDNHPDGPCAAPLKKLEDVTPRYRYVPNDVRRGTGVRDFIFEEAIGDFVLCMDSHVFVVPGAIKQLLEYFDANPAMSDLVQGPLLYDDLSTVSTHFSPQWREGMYGTWECDERGKDSEAPPFDIPMQGLGLFACRRAAWPGFNPRFRGFGGEEGYIHEKFRQRGGRTLCLPFLRWMHRFQRPFGVPYRNTWEDRIRNYMIGFNELGLDTGPIEEHFTTLLGAEPAKRIFTTIREELEA